MSLFWPTYFRSKYQQWHDDGESLIRSKDKMKQKITNLYEKVRRKVNCIIVLFVHICT